ncbi:Gfo/Idh/MocA family protein [Virgibacillus halodenitrificans]|uniref:Gfo/Idh/MocA family protein n=1 Tax=Virgibacillus halodenitrificans TaxID=1482 RepID=UPI00076153C2
MLKIGVIGVGSISNSHIEAYLKNEQVELTAFCDINEDRLKEKGELFGVKKLYKNYEELLKDEGIDAVSICTWNNTHSEIAISALENDKHVLVEKPLSMNVEEALAVEAAVERTGKILQVGFVRRHGDNTRVLKTFIDNNQLGEIYYAKASCMRRLGNPGGWFSDITKSGGGPLIDLGVHMIDTCWYLMGKPNPVSVSGNKYSKLGNRSHIKNLSYYKAADYDAKLNDVEDLANALIRFENGQSLYIDVSFTLHAKSDEVKIQLFGENGGAEIEPELALIAEQHDTILNITPQIDNLGFNFSKAFSNEINHFVECCLEGKETIAPVSDGVQLMRILQAIYESAVKEKEVYL